MPAATPFATGPMPDGAWAGAPPARPHGGAGCSIYIKGMPEDADKLWLYEKFSRFGGILSVRVLLDEHTGRCNGIGFVNFTDPEGARAAHETMNGVSMGERLLHVMVQSHGGARGTSSGGPRSHPSGGSLAAAAASMGTSGGMMPQGGHFMPSGDFLQGNGGW
jgi:RNA recognition motif-containing protein